MRAPSSVGRSIAEARYAWIVGLKAHPGGGDRSVAALVNRFDEGRRVAEMELQYGVCLTHWPA